MSEKDKLVQAVQTKNETNTDASIVSSVSDKIPICTNKTSTPSSVAAPVQIIYREGQWSPNNPQGRKIYDRDQLVALAKDPKSNRKPNLPLDLDEIKNYPKQYRLDRLAESNRFSSMNKPHAGEIQLPEFGKSSVSQRGPLSKQNSPKKGKIKAEIKPIIHVTLSLTENVKLNETENDKKSARFKSVQEHSEEDVKTEALYKKVRDVLNKLTHQNVDTFVSQIRNFDIDNCERLQGVVDLVFEKAINEPNYSVAYALMCRELALMQVPVTESKNSNSKEPESVNFKKLLITRCQMEFEKSYVDETVRNKRLKEIEEETNPEKKKELQVLLEEDDRRARLKSVGNVRFIGELFKQQMLTANIMMRCLNNLLTPPMEEENLECLCKLLITVGKDLEIDKNMSLQPYFQTMQEIVDKKHGKISSRVRFMLQDVIDLRNNKWIPQRADGGHHVTSTASGPQQGPPQQQAQLPMRGAMAPAGPPNQASTPPQTDGMKVPPMPSQPNIPMAFLQQGAGVRGNQNNFFRQMQPPTRSRQPIFQPPPVPAVYTTQLTQSAVVLGSQIPAPYQTSFQPRTTQGFYQLPFQPISTQPMYNYPNQPSHQPFFFQHQGGPPMNLISRTPQPTPAGAQGPNQPVATMPMNHPNQIQQPTVPKKTRRCFAIPIIIGKSKLKELYDGDESAPQDSDESSACETPQPDSRVEITSDFQKMGPSISRIDDPGNEPDYRSEVPTTDVLSHLEEIMQPDDIIHSKLREKIEMTSSSESELQAGTKEFISEMNKNIVAPPPPRETPVISASDGIEVFVCNKSSKERESPVKSRKACENAQRTDSSVQRESNLVQSTTNLMRENETSRDVLPPLVNPMSQLESKNIQHKPPVLQQGQSLREGTNIPKEQVAPHISQHSVQRKDSSNLNKESSAYHSDTTLTTTKGKPSRQWSPNNPQGKKIYDREQLFALAKDPKSNRKPNLPQDLDIIKKYPKQQHRLAEPNRFSNMNKPHEAVIPSPQHGNSSVSQRQPLPKRNKAETEPVILVTSSLKEELNETENAWKPADLNPDQELSEEDAKTEIRDVLIKQTPENVDTCVSQIRNLVIDNSEKLQGVIDLIFEKEKKKELQILLEEDDRRVRLKSIGNVRFIGELFKQQILTVSIMIRYINNLLTSPMEEENLECLCELLKTVGKDLEIDKKMSLQSYFQTMQEIVEKKHGRISGKIRFMLQDVIDLRNNNWIPRRQDLKPTATDQIQKEADTEQLNIQLMNSAPLNISRKNDQGSGGSGSNVSEDGWSPTPSRGRTPFSVESSKLKSTKPTTIDDEKLGSRSPFMKWNRGSTPLSSQPITTTNMYSALEIMAETERTRQSAAAETNEQKIERFQHEIQDVIDGQYLKSTTINQIQKEANIEDENYPQEEVQQTVERLQNAINKIQMKYQKEMERLERDNRELRKQNLLLKSGHEQPQVGSSIQDHTNIGEEDVKEKEFIRALVTAICERSIQNMKLNEDIFKKHLDFLFRYMDNKPDREMQCFYALHAYIHKLGLPPGLILKTLATFFTAIKEVKEDSSSSQVTLME